MCAYYSTLKDAIAAETAKEGIVIDDDGDVIDANGDVRRDFSMDIRRSEDGTRSYACAFESCDTMTVMFEGSRGDIARIVRGEYDPEKDFDPDWISGFDEATVEALAETDDQEPLWSSCGLGGSVIRIYPSCMINERNHCDNGGWEREVTSRRLNEGLSRGVADALDVVAREGSDFQAVNFAHDLFDTEILPENVDFTGLVNLVVKSAEGSLEDIAEKLECSVSGLNKWKAGDGEPKGRALKAAVEDLVVLYHDNLLAKARKEQAWAEADEAIAP